MPGGLYVVATPIGNLEDITLRALRILKGAALIACEDTRVTAKLLRHYGIATPLLSCHDHNEASRTPEILKRLETGAAVALVSDAGTPLVSDPGYRLVRACRAAGHPVTAVPGACACVAALSVAGLPTDRFFFAGFLPPRSAARRTALAPLAGIEATLAFHEAPSRLAASLADMAAVLGAEREAAVAREITKLFEETRRGPLAGLAAHYASAGPPKGEIVVLVGPPVAVAEEASDVDALLRAALRQLSLRDAVAEVANATGLPRGEVYRRALAAKELSEGKKR